MNSRVLFLLFIFTACGIGPAAAQKQRGPAPLGVDSVHRPFDITSYDLSLDWRPVFENKSFTYTGLNKIVLVGTDSADEIVLDAAYMHIDQIGVNGARLSAEVQPDANEQLHIPLSLWPGKLYELDISYTHTAQDIEGLYFYPKGLFVGMGPANDSVFTTEDVAYTMSEPLDAHKWMPCMDRPYDKATSKISIRVPAGITAQSNGLLSKVDTNTDGSLTFHWVNETPISTYLMVADASNFVEWTTWYARVTDTTQKVPVYNYAWPSDYYQTADSSGFKYNAQFALKKTPDMIAAFSRRFGEYPFVKYGMVPVQPFSFGGMEHQTLTTINRSWLRGWYEDGIAHELMHQWFGDKTTCATWSDIWLNEGFASYGEAIWEESEYGPDSYLRVIRNQANGFFSPRSWETNAIPVYDPPIDNIFNYPTTYAKGSCVLHMLRRAIDDDTLFFNSLRDYSNAFAYTTATTWQFTNFMARRLGARLPFDFHTYIDQWIMTAGFPVYNIHWASVSNGWLVVKVDQQQAGRSYVMPLRLLLRDTAGRASSITVLDSASTQLFKVKLPTRIAQMTFDTGAVVLSDFRLVHDPSLEALSVAQAPALASSVTRTETGWSVAFATPISGALRIFDVLGREVFTLPVAETDSRIMVPSNRLSRGVFWGRIECAVGTSTFKIEN